MKIQSLVDMLKVATGRQLSEAQMASAIPAEKRPSMLGKEPIDVIIREDPSKYEFSSWVPLPFERIKQRTTPFYNHKSWNYDSEGKLVSRSYQVIIGSFYRLVHEQFNPPGCWFGNRLL